MTRNNQYGDDMYPTHDGMARRSMTPLLAIYEMGANETIFRSVAKDYELAELDLAYACLAMALDRCYGCTTPLIENRVRQWLEASERPEFSQLNDDRGLFAGLVLNMEFLADIIHGVLLKTVDPKRYEIMRADRVDIRDGVLFLYIHVLESLV